MKTIKLNLYEAIQLALMLGHCVEDTRNSALRNLRQALLMSIGGLGISRQQAEEVNPLPLLQERAVQSLMRQYQGEDRTVHGKSVSFLITRQEAVALANQSHTELA